MKYFICNRCYRRETTTITYSEFVILALVIQHGMRMRRLSSVSGPTLQYLSTLSHKRHYFRKKKIERKM
jgi:hypothetical protein